MAQPYAQDSDLDTYDKAVRKLSSDSFVDQLTLASNDILNLIKGTWWPNATNISLNSFDEANLNEAALLQITIFKALGDYIYPSLSQFKENDTLKAKADFYKQRFKEEWEVIKDLPLYDWDEDASFEDSERPGPFSVDLSRG